MASTAEKTALSTSTAQQKKSDSFFKPIVVQPKLQVNEPGDAFEQEADAVADQVMRMPAGSDTFFSPGAPAIQRKCAHCEEDEKQVQRKEASPETAYAADSYLQSPAGGAPMRDDERSFFESRMGQDFSDVQIHNSSAANESAGGLNALAYTHGNDIVFGEGQYQPGTDSGRHLLAHELTHVVQQSGGTSTPGIQRRNEFSVEGLFEGRGRPEHRDFVYFDLSLPDQDVDPEADLNSDERHKIGLFATAHPDGISLYGFNSEEGGAAENAVLVSRRMQAVRNVLTGAPISYAPANITTQALPAASHHDFDYRFWRVVEMKPINQPSSRIQSATAAANRGMEPCTADSENNVVIPARDEAVRRVSNTIDAVTAYIGDHAAHTDTGNALRTVFRSDSDVVAHQVINRLDASKTFLENMMSILQCGTDQSVDCGSTAEALTNSTSITLCTAFFRPTETLAVRSGVLIHESNHGGRFGLNDRAYRSERVLPMLNTRQALDNAESFLVFVETLDTGTVPHMGPTDVDIAHNCGADEQIALEAVAWAERWNTYATFGLQQTYGQDARTRLMAPHINFYFGRSDLPTLAGILDKYLQFMHFFDGGTVNIQCVDRADPLYNTWKIAHWNVGTRTVQISNEQLHQSYLNQSDRIKYIYGALAVDGFGVPEAHRMAYPNVARAFKLFYWHVEG